MTDANFLRILRELSSVTANIKLSRHARERMSERGFTVAQIYACVRRGVIYEPVHQDVRGDFKCTLRHTHAGDEIHVAVALKRNARGDWIAVLTVF
ncbi:DUF4258 domain-containing protein [Pigmentiphaga soli]